MDKQPKWHFRATVTQDMRIAGHDRFKKGEVFYPKGFYYNGLKEKWVILVGDVYSGHTIRLKMLRDSVNIEIRQGGDETW